MLSIKRKSRGYKVLIIKKENIRILKGKAQYLKWRLLSKTSRSEGAELYDVDKVYWIEINRIKLSLDDRARDRLTEKENKTVTPMLERGKVAGGDWDEKTIEFESQDVWVAFLDHFENGKSWDETDFYMRVITTIKGGIPMWGCKTQEDFDERLNGVESLYIDIKENGYFTQDKINAKGYKPYGNEDEIQVHIGRNGDYIFGDGRHRLCIAKLLKLEKVPVKVSRRHEDWVNFRKEILSYADKQPSKKLYSRLTHPDLEGIPAVHEGDDRLKLIKDNLPVTSGTLLDIGSHWGYFCQKLEPLGFECVATEYLKINQYFLNRLRDIEKKEFRIIPGSILSFQENQHFDIVLALNIFHHFIKTYEEFEQLESLLGRLDADSMFLETHASSEAQMRKQNSYKNFEPNEFAVWVQELGGFKHGEHLGETSEGRQLYLLTS